MKRWGNRNGIALILTISVLTGMSILGISFLGLLARDQKLSQSNTVQWVNEGALNGAVSAGVWEIRNQLSIYPEYFGSTIESKKRSGGAAVPPIYFSNVIRATNAKMCLYQESPEVFNVLPHLIDQLNITEKGEIKNIFNIWKIYHPEWKTMNHLSEWTKIDESTSLYKIEAYEQLVNHLTVYPKPAEMTVNIIDYGQCEAGLNNELNAKDRDFLPVSIGHDPLSGALVEIIAGPGYDPVTPNIRKVKQVNTTDTSRLVLDQAWPAGKTPTADSYYRLYAYVSPVNINAASEILVQSNFKVMEEFFQDVHGSYPIGAYTASCIGLMGQLYDYRLGIKKSLIKLQGMDTIQSFDYFLSNVFTDDEVRRTVLRQFLPYSPKGVWDGSKYVIYPLPVPFCCTNNGYFDMKIDAAMKVNVSSDKKPRSVSSVYSTVKVGGAEEHTLKEDFENETQKLQGMTTSDFVPVRFLRNVQDWSRVYSTAVSASAIFRPYNSTIGSTVIPDAIKTGLWFDFMAPGQGMGSSLFFNEMTNSFSSMNSLYNVFDSGTVIGTIEPDLSAKGKLIVHGNGGSAQSSIILGNASGYKFSDASVIAEIEDLTETIGAANVLVHQIPHPSDAALWYDFGGSGRDITNHLWGDHKLVDATNRSYPPGRSFTPSLAIRNYSGTDAGVVRFEYGYEKAGDYNNSGYETTCLQTDLDSNLKAVDKFSVAGSMTSTTDLTDYVSHYKIFSAVTDQHPGKECKFSFQDCNNLVAQASVYSTGTTFTNAAGNVRFFRNFDSGYYSGGHTGSFAIRCLRVIPGLMKDGSNDVYPFYESSLLALPDSCSSIKKIRIHYQVGQKSALNDWHSTNDSIKFLISLDMWKQTDSLGLSGPFSVNSSSVYVESVDALSGQVDIAVNNMDYNLNHTGKLYKYQIAVRDDGDSAIRHMNFILSTIAITKVEVFYESETEIVSFLDTP